MTARRRERVSCRRDDRFPRVLRPSRTPDQRRQPGAVGRGGRRRVVRHRLDRLDAVAGHAASSRASISRCCVEGGAARARGPEPVRPGDGRRRLARRRRPVLLLPTAGRPGDGAGLVAAERRRPPPVGDRGHRRLRPGRGAARPARRPPGPPDGDPGDRRRTARPPVRRRRAVRQPRRLVSARLRGAPAGRVARRVPAGPRWRAAWRSPSCRSRSSIPRRSCCGSRCVPGRRAAVRRAACWPRPSSPGSPSSPSASLVGGLQPWLDYVTVVRAAAGSALVDARNVGPVSLIGQATGIDGSAVRGLQLVVVAGVVS